MPVVAGIVNVPSTAQTVDCVVLGSTGVTTTITLPAVNTTATLISVAGVTTTLAAKRGRYELTLPAALCNDPTYGCTVGGAPLIVVENQPAKK